MLELRVGRDVVTARIAAREMVREAGLGVMDQTRFAAAVSELARNAVHYGVAGCCDLSNLSNGTHLRIQARVSDTGPGIADIALALQDGYSTGGSMGAGLPAARRLADVFDIESSQAGTLVTIQIVRARRL
jgi:serine/threonine-protein kinase RsbT